MIIREIEDKDYEGFIPWLTKALAALHAGHVSALVDIGQDEPACGFLQVHARWDYAFSRARAKRAGFVALYAFAGKVRR